MPYKYSHAVSQKRQGMRNSENAYLHINFMNHPVCLIVYVVCVDVNKTTAYLHISQSAFFIHFVYIMAADL